MYGWIVVAGLLQALVSLQVVHLLLPLAGALLARLLPRPEAPVAPPLRLAVLIAAHNEAPVLGGALASLARQTHPAHAFDVFVVADHCSDATAEVARRTGATVLERRGGGTRTKGAALRDLWASVRPLGHAGVVVLDADNHAAPTLLAALSDALAAGHLAVQGLRRARPGSGTAGLDALTELCTHRIGAAGRVRLGLGAPLMGSGMAFEARTFARLIGAVGTTVVEDCAWQAELALRDVAVHWTATAVVEDEKTRTAASMGTQRTRWLTGRAQVARRYTGPLLARFARRGSWLALDTALGLLALPRSVLALAVAGCGGVSLLLPGLPGWWPMGWWGGLTLALLGYVAAGLRLDGGAPSDARSWLRLLRHGPGFAWQMARATWLAFRGAEVAWLPTPHGPTEAPGRRP
ncbi:MAG: glycosyltransferase family 2 protein [Candidatus Sericytochromatia bacterium]|nr:glycosyltransferase family 2 protein [Candidatus Sericytochromatia bacterium]